MADDCAKLSVESQKEDPDSMLNLVRKIIQLRRSEPALTLGEHRLIITEMDGPIIAWRREHETGNFLIALNLSDAPAKLELPRGYDSLEEVISTISGRGAGSVTGSIDLRGNEGVILKSV